MAADEKVPQPIFDFSVISEGGEGRKSNPPWDETVWEADSPTSWNKGQKLGEVRMNPMGSSPNPDFRATFKWDDRRYKPSQVEGKVPGGDQWQGQGKAKAKSEGRDDKEVDIEFVNPKRWG